MSILVCGGAGYIGSHTCVELINAGYEVIIADNFSNSSPRVIERLEQIVGLEICVEKVDLCDKGDVEQVFLKHDDIDAVIHFAGYKAVGESVEKPLKYYYNNITSAINVLEAMMRFNVKNFVFSSSATVYGEPDVIPINEECNVGKVTNPYGATKLYLENILRDCYSANPSLNISILRYFNPIGAHESGLIGEDPNGIPNNLVPYIAKVAIGEYDCLHVYGVDYPTEDGTGVRDYIHVVDLAKGHVAAVKKLESEPGLFVCNLGTGIGYSVLDVLKAYEHACGKKLKYVEEARREGDVATCYADPSRAYELLGWKAELDLNDMCKSSWKWQSMNPKGYSKI